MIKINQVEEKHPFPVVDFKFQNTGKGKAYLWEFIININSIIVDITPVLKFRYEIKDNEFRIIVKNDGYGSALNSKLTVTEKTLNKLLKDNSFQFDIGSGEEKEIGRIDKALLNIDLLKGKTKLDKISVDWNCKAEDGRLLIDNVSYIDCSYEYSAYYSSTVYIDKKGFIEATSYHHVSFCLRSPSEIYCVILDLSSRELKKQYPISREIAPGDIDRFHIMIGSDKSAKIELSFSFKIDQNIIINSDLFEINTWRPLNQKKYDYYIDGDIIKAQLEEKMVNIEKDELRDYEIERLKHRLDIIKSDSNYPFLTENNKDIY